MCITVKNICVRHCIFEVHTTSIIAYFESGDFLLGFFGLEASLMRVHYPKLRYQMHLNEHRR